MAITVSFGGNSYQVPEVSEYGWGESLTQYLVALSSASSASSMTFSTRRITSTPSNAQPSDCILALAVSPCTLTLPAGVVGQFYGVYDATGLGAQTILTTGGETIRGATSLTLAPYDGALLQWTGDEWAVLSRNVPALTGTGNRLVIAGADGSLTAPNLTAVYAYGSYTPVFDTPSNMVIASSTSPNLNPPPIRYHRIGSQVTLSGAIVASVSGNNLGSSVAFSVPNGWEIEDAQFLGDTYGVTGTCVGDNAGSPWTQLSGSFFRSPGVGNKINLFISKTTGFQTATQTFRFVLNYFTKTP